MPAYLTHRAAGERVRPALDIQHIPAYYLGCQGPDMLFFHNYQPWRKSKDCFHLGVEMHGGHTRALLEYLTGFVRDYSAKDREQLIAYAAGFITHYAVDKNAHPFVYAKTGTDEALHQAFEYMWDSYTSAEQWHMEPGKFDIYSEVMFGSLGDGICEWYRLAANELYGWDIPADDVRQAQRHFARAKRGLAHVGPLKRVYLKLIGAVMGFDSVSLLYPIRRDESLFSASEYANMRVLLENGVREAQEMLPVALRIMRKETDEPLPAWFGDKDFSGKSV